MNKPIHNFDIGDIVFYVTHQHTVDWGVVEGYYMDGYCLELYELADRRTINGVPIKEFKFNAPRKKLPKGWTYDYDLCKVDYTPYPDYLLDLYEHNIDNYKRLIEEGFYVKPSTNPHGHINSDINKDGYTIVLQYYYSDKYCPDYISVNQIYATYEEAKKICDDYYAELKRQAELSDYDWSVEQIDKSLARAPIDDEQKVKIREWLLKQDNVEDIVTRYGAHGFEWKYDRNSRWVKCEI